MNLLLAINIAPDLGMLPPHDWLPDEQLQIDTRFIRRLLSGYDECAAEMVLMLRDVMALNLSVLTIADATVDPVLKQLLALEYQQAVRITPPAEWDLRFNSMAVAALIAAYQQQIATHSVIVMGKQSIEGQNGQTPLLLAEHLNWPCITGVCHLAPATEAGALQVTRQTAYGMEVMTVMPPMVLVVGNAQQASALRVPTLKQKLAAAKRQVCSLTPGELGITALPTSHVQLCRLTPIEHRRAGVVIEGDSVAQKVQRLCQEYLTDRWSL